MKDKIKSLVTIRQTFDALGVKVRGRVALCPLHQDTHPSMSFSDRENLWYCFVCGIGGDVFTLVQKTLHISFKDTLAWFNDKFSLGLEFSKPKRNHYLEALAENYEALKSGFKEDSNNLSKKYAVIIDKIRPCTITAKDYTFEYVYNDLHDIVELKLGALEDARHTLRNRTVTAQ